MIAAKLFCSQKKKGVNNDQLAVFSLLRRVQDRYLVVDPQFALLFILFLTKSAINFEILAPNPELVRQVKAWKELIDVNFDTAAAILATEPSKFWSLVAQCRVVFEAELKLLKVSPIIE